jgi:hypothetical protein
VVLFCLLAAHFLLPNADKLVTCEHYGLHGAFA